MAGVMACGPDGAIPVNELPEGDRHEVARFAAFLRASSHLPARRQQTPEQQAEAARIYREHYPEHATEDTYNTDGGA